MKNEPYATLALAVGVHFFVMGADLRRRRAWDHIFLNLNRFYMAVVMVAPMVIVMLVAMRDMFTNKALNFGIAIASVALFVAAFAAIRTQAFVGDAGCRNR